MDYRVLIFDIDTDSASTEENQLDHDPEQIKLACSKETLDAIPLMKEEFMDKIFDSVIADRDFAEKLALGCQQIARSVCFVHYWAFNALWLTFNSSKNLGQKKKMKELLEQAERDRLANEEKIQALERERLEQEEKTRQQKEADRLQYEKERQLAAEQEKERQAEAERQRLLMLEEQKKRDMEAEN